MKNIFYSGVSLLLFLPTTVLGKDIPEIHCWGLPWCGGDSGWVSESWIFDIIWNFISLMIQYTAVIAVIAVMVGGVMYLTSSGEEEKVKRAKKVIIWAMVWVFVSILAFSIINILNEFVL